MGEQAEGLGQLPGRRGIGGKTLVEHHHRTRQLGPRQVGKDLGQRVRQHHGLVAQGRGRQRHHVEVRFVRQRLFGGAAGQEQRALETGRLAIRTHEYLLDARQPAPRDLAAVGQRHRHHPPARHDQALRLQRRGQGRTRTRGRGLVRRQEDRAAGITRPEGQAGFARDRFQEGLRPPQQQAAAVAAEAVGANGAPMGQPRQGPQPGVDQGPRGPVVDLGDQPEPAAVALEIRGMQARCPGSGHTPLHGK